MDDPLSADDLLSEDELDLVIDHVRRTNLLAGRPGPVMFHVVLSDDALAGRADPVVREVEEIEVRPKPAEDRPALAARFQSIPPDRWQSANAPFDDAIAAQLRVRCGIKDCPGDFGRISLTVSPEPINGTSEHVVFELARGLVERADGVWAEGSRTQALRKRGLPPRARRPQGQPADWDGSRPLGTHELPAESIGLGRRGGSTAVECPICHRLVRVHGREAYVALAIQGAFA